MKTPNSVLGGYGTTIFETMSRLAEAHGAVNLGQGFPEGLEPEALLELAAGSILRGPNQYPSMMGTMSLRQAIAAHDSRFYGLKIDPSWVMVTSGATEALADCLFGLIEPGDEVVLIEPLYDSYLPIVRRAGAVPRLVRLEAPDWRLPKEELAAAFGPKTKMILVNSPMNPCGKVFDAEELSFIASLVIGHDCLAVCDEVYEHLVFDQRRHHPLIGLPGMTERALRIVSAGKTFSLTGWKVGAVIACPALLGPVARAHQFITFTTPPALQAAVAEALAWPDGYFDGLVGDLEARRDRLAAGLRAVGFNVLPTAGTYFLTAGIDRLAKGEDDFAFCRRLTIEAKVAAVPVGAFYTVAPPNAFVRFCFAKPDAVLDLALQRLGAYFA